MSKHLPTLGPGWEYLYRIPKGTIVEIGSLRYEVRTIDGLFAYLRPIESNGLRCCDSLLAVKLVADNNNKKEKEKKKNEVRLVQRNPKSGRTKKEV